MTFQSVTDESFTTELENNSMLLVDFWAPWCGPCKNLEPELVSAAKQLPNLKIVKANVDDTTMGLSLGVRGIPTLILFQNGKEKARLTGANSRTKIIEFVDNNS